MMHSDSAMKKALLLLLLLPACRLDTPEIQGPSASEMDWVIPGETREARIVEELGQPWSLREDDQGRRYYIYAHQDIWTYKIPDNSEAVLILVENGVVTDLQVGDYLPAN
ncbi:MAG: hypothetical protein DWQ01_17710 [Planctomycetota bacterium]|nr:MAG: hypothetical protein DWQ01_17710 [Planctomycetota bacterium]